MINVVKRDGTRQPLNLDKFHTVVAKACEGISGVSPSEIELKSQIQFYNNIQTASVQETLIKAAADLITEETPNYQYVAGRLVNYHLRKEAYLDFSPPHLANHVNHMVDLGLYDRAVLDMFDMDEWNELNKIIDHNRDNLLTYMAMEQFRGKYLVRDRTTEKFYETPQMAYMMIAATLFGHYPKETRMAWIADFYDAISTHEISVATPIMAGIRTPQRQFSSCVLIEIGDNLDSIIAASGVVKKYVSARAGIGLGSQLRSEKDPVKNGMVSHTGKIPYWKAYAADVGSCSQGGVRKGSATMNEAIFDLEIENLLVLKNNKGTEETRIRQLDYVFHLNKLFYQRYIEDGKITLFSRGSAPEVFEAFYRNDPNFQEIYERAERSHVRKKVIGARELLDKLAEERFNTGRIYIMNIDHANEHGSFIPELAPIKMTNLCVEVTLPTTALNDLNDPNGEVALCTLLAWNYGKIKTPADFLRLARLSVRALNILLDYQDYEVPAARNATMARRPLGIGIMGLAHFLAKNDTNYSNPNLPLIHEYLEAHMFYLIQASMELAKEDPSKIPTKFNETKYSLGIMPIDHYKKDVDQLVPNKLNLDWKWLSENVLEFGMANSTLAAAMPGETSSTVLNAPSGVDPVSALVMSKGSKNTHGNQVVPEIRRLKNKYELQWDIRSPKGYLSIMAVIQKFFDQAISANTSYNPAHYPDNAVTLDDIMDDILFAYKYGLKTLYYNNTAPITTESLDDPVDLPTEQDQQEEDCEACKL